MNAPAGPDDDFDGFDEEPGCWNCGGEGVVYDCIEDFACIDPEGGCDLCGRACDVCAPPRRTSPMIQLEESDLPY